MARTLFLFDWDEGTCAQRVAQLRAAGWEVAAECEDGARGVRRVLNSPPTVLVFDLARRPSHSRECVKALRGYRATRRVPMLFIDGKDSDVERIRTLAPGALFTTRELFVERLDGFDG